MRYQILGPLEVMRDRERVPLGGPKQRLVLAHLLIRARELVSADLLIDEIWGDEPPDAARASLQSYVSHLRAALGADLLVGRAPGYVLHASAEDVDATRFEALVAQARRVLTTDPASAARTLRDALGIWQGEPLADLSNERSLQPEIERLSAMRLGALEDRIEADLALGRHGDIVSEMERLVARHPLRERLYAQLMLALYRVGRQADALAAYHQLRGALETQLGLDPSPALEALQGQILNHDVALDLRGEPLRGYRIVEQIGSGPLGVVHRAFEPQTERDVAIKVLGARVANEPDFVRRFDAEARQVARLEHPHIVPLYDWWREPDAAYLVMRLMTGGSLADRLAAGPVTWASALHWTEQIGAALGAGHRQGLVHGDVRPGNVIFDGDDNAYLTDFAIGFDPAASGSSKRSSSEMRYLAPERRTGATPSSAADIYAMGVVVGELLDGATPHEAEIDLGPILERATSETPTERQPSAIDLAAAVRTAVLAPTGIPASVDRPGAPLRNPFKGLRAFEEADAADFFGRDALVGQLVARLTEGGEASRLLAVVGPSGSGKSSVVNAGLIPALREGAVPGSDEWFVASMTPGAWPFDQLERALLSVAVDAPASLAELLNADEGLRPSVERSLPPGAELLLVIDQFEELFTLAEPELRERFLDTLARTIEDEASRVRVVITLRADFYDRPLRHERFGRQLAARTHAVPPLTPEELERVVAAPAERARLQLEQGLVARIVADVSEQTGGLPLLQYALTELWEGRDGSRLSLRAYDASGGIAGAVGRRAEHLVRQLDAGESEAARQLFLRLVEPGEGTPDTSRRVRTSELETLSDERGRMAAVIESFARYRLLLFDRDAATREPTLELAHEALLRAWPRLQQWVDDARDDLRNQRHLAAAAAQWAEAGRDTSFLLTGSRLELTDEWAASTQLLLTSADHEYLAAGVVERRRLEAEEEERRGREAKLERRGLNRLRALVLVMGIGALLAGGLSVIALNESQRASREARFATARELAAAAVANLDVDTERSVLLALQAVQETRSTDGSVLPEAEEALHRAVVASRVVLTVRDDGGAVEWTQTPQGRSIFVTEGPEESGVVSIRDATTGEVIRSWHGHDVDVNDVAFSRDGSMLATTGDDGYLRIWETTTGEKLAEVTGGSADVVWGPSFSPDGTLAAAAWRDKGVVRVLDIDRHTVRQIDAGGFSLSTSFSADGKRLAVALLNDSMARVFDLPSLEEVFNLRNEAVQMIKVKFSPDGRWIATASYAGTATIWDAASGALRYTLSGHSFAVRQLAWSPDSRQLLTGSDDGTARLWQITDEGYQQLLSFSSQDMPGGINGVAFSPDGHRVITGDLTIHAVKIWNVGIDGDAEWMNLPAVSGDFNAMAVMPDGRIVASSGPGSMTIWDPESGKALLTVREHEDTARAIEASPDGKLIASADFHQVKVWDPATGTEAFTVQGPADPESIVDHGIAWSWEGDFLAVPTNDGVTIVDRTGREVRRLALEPGFRVTKLTFSRDGLIAGAVEPTQRDEPTARQVIVWDSSNGRVVKTIPAPSTNSALFDPTGTRLAARRNEGGALIWDLKSGAAMTLAGDAGWVQDIAFSPDGSRIATAGADATVRLWDAHSGVTELVLRGDKLGVTQVRFSPDGKRLISVGSDGVVRVWALDLDDLIAIARRNVTRDLTPSECLQYLHVATCPAPTGSSSGAP
jgi:WD40 repeat protein/DNA-binding SARP family transcriptional activator